MNESIYANRLFGRLLLWCLLVLGIQIIKRLRLKDMNTTSSSKCHTTHNEGCLLLLLGSLAPGKRIVSAFNIGDYSAMSYVHAGNPASRVGVIVLSKRLHS